MTIDPNSYGDLPPLNIVDPARVLVALAWDATQEGLVAFENLEGPDAGELSGEPSAVVYLSVRGWKPSDATRDAPAVWDQLHVAIPLDLVGPIAQAMTNLAHLTGGS